MRRLPHPGLPFCPPGADLMVVVYCSMASWGGTHDRLERRHDADSLVIEGLAKRRRDKSSSPVPTRICCFRCGCGVSRMKVVATFALPCEKIQLAVVAEGPSVLERIHED